MRVEATSRDEYLQAVGDRARDLEAMDALIRTAAPDLEPYFLATPSMTALAYGPYHFRYASGREVEWPIVGLAAQKNHLALYVCVAKDGQYLVESYGKRLGKASCGKSCLRFKKLTDLDLPAVDALLREASTLARQSGNLLM